MTEPTPQEALTTPSRAEELTAALARIAELEAEIKAWTPPQDPREQDPRDPTEVQRLRQQLAAISSAPNRNSELNRFVVGCPPEFDIVDPGTIEMGDQVRTSSPSGWVSGVVVNMTVNIITLVERGERITLDRTHDLGRWMVRRSLLGEAEISSAPAPAPAETGRGAPGSVHAGAGSGALSRVSFDVPMTATVAELAAGLQALLRQLPDALFEMDAGGMGRAHVEWLAERYGLPLVAAMKVPALVLTATAVNLEAAWPGDAPAEAVNVESESESLPRTVRISEAGIEEIVVLDGVNPVQTVGRYYAPSISVGYGVGDLQALRARFVELADPPPKSVAIVLGRIDRAIGDLEADHGSGEIGQSSRIWAELMATAVGKGAQAALRRHSP